VSPSLTKLPLPELPPVGWSDVCYRRTRAGWHEGDSEVSLNRIDWAVRLRDPSSIPRIDSTAASLFRESVTSLLRRGWLQMSRERKILSREKQRNRLSQARESKLRELMETECNGLSPQTSCLSIFRAGQCTTILFRNLVRNYRAGDSTEFSPTWDGLTSIGEPAAFGGRWTGILKVSN